MSLRIMEDLKLHANPGALLLLNKVSHSLIEESVRSYLVGGFVRDILLGRDTADIDIAVAADALEIAPRVANALGGRYVPLDEINRVGRVVLTEHDTGEKWELDFSTLKGNIEDDLAQRDFAIDAMAIELDNIICQPVSSGERGELSLELSMLIDPFDGWHDIRQRIIRAVNNMTFKSDPARLLRAVRLAAELDFSIDSKTEALIQPDCHLASEVAGERVREELIRILAIPGTWQILNYLDELGLLTTLIPELAQTKGIEQPTVHFWDVFDHSLRVVAAMDFLFRQGNWDYASKEVLPAVPWSEALSQHFDQEISSGSTRRSLVKLAALLHDISKPQTKATDEDGRARFLGHAKEGATIAADILKRLRFSTKEIKLVEAMVSHHLRPGQMSHEGLPSNRATYRYFRDTGESGIDILFLSLADHLATRGPNLDPAQWQKHTQVVEYVLAKHFEDERLIVPPKLIDGHDLINIFGMSPGPEIGKLLEAVREAQAAGEVTHTQEALTYIKHSLTHSKEASTKNSS
ncbi:CCA tRNA nucleotidyltransferase [Chloroflexota bacterium]